MRISEENEYYGKTSNGEKVSFSFEKGTWVATDSTGLVPNIPAKHRDLFVLKAFLNVVKISRAELQPA